MGRSEERIAELYRSITGLWKFMRKYLTAEQIDWKELVANSYHGDDEFTARIYVAAIREIERCKKESSP